MFGLRWKPAVQLPLTVPRANFRREVQRSISPRSKVITVRPLKLESSNVPRLNGHDGCRICDHFCDLRSFASWHWPGRQIMARSGGIVDDAMWRHVLYSVMHRQSGPFLLCAGMWSKVSLGLLHFWQTMVSARGARRNQGTS